MLSLSLLWKMFGLSLPLAIVGGYFLVTSWTAKVELSRWLEIQTPLGEKGKSEILKSMETRAAFLSDKAHRIQFLYLPKRASWLNQIELWFSILVRRLLKRLSVRSKAELFQKLSDFIQYFNTTMAKTFKWTYTGRPLAV
jgi:hypothetical protein